ncbi:hypothetical protein Q9189_005286, partial [Teloschistes chrysophthalmus]
LLYHELLNHELLNHELLNHELLYHELLNHELLYHELLIHELPNHELFVLDNELFVFDFELFLVNNVYALIHIYVLQPSHHIKAIFIFNIVIEFSVLHVQYINRINSHDFYPVLVVHNLIHNPNSRIHCNCNQWLLFTWLLRGAPITYEETDGPATRGRRDESRPLYLCRLVGQCKAESGS